MPPRMRRRITSAKREEIELEQKQISNTIVRPFDIVSGLPVSYNAPPNGHYEDVLKKPLTVKDTGVFYRSLMKSRYTYVFLCPMFRLYWLKQSSYAKKLAELDKPIPKSLKDEVFSDRDPVLGLDVSARDVMVKLCDASMTLGPHYFEIRLFIAKDERSEKVPKKDKTEAEDAPSTPEPTKSTNDIPPAPITNNATSAPAPVPVPSPAPASAPVSTPAPAPTPVPVSVSRPQEPAVSTSQQPKSLSNTEPVSENKPSASSPINSDPIKAAPTSTTSPEQTQPPSNTTPSTSTTTSEPVTSTTKPQPPSFLLSGAKSLGSINSNPPSSTHIPAPTGPDFPKAPSSLLSSSRPSFYDTKPTITPVPTSSPPKPKSSSPLGSSSSARPLTTSTDKPSPDAPPKSDLTNMQSIENTIMISNLNSIARQDESLNKLMKIVASGSASPHQILTFQGYIKRAREMGPQPHHAYLFHQGSSSNSNSPGFLDRKKERKPREKKEKKADIPRDQKLTAFQEKYLMNATLLFEYVENPNVRFQIPKDAVFEVVDPKLEEHVDEDVKDVIVSFIWIHNQKEVDLYEQQLKEYNDHIKAKEEEARKLQEEEEKQKEQEKQDEAKASETVSEAPTIADSEAAPSTADKPDSETTETTNKDEAEAEPTVKVEAVEEKLPPRTKRVLPKRSAKKKKAPPRKAVEKKWELPTEPEIKFTTLSFTIHGIPTKFLPIFTNSVKPLSVVQERMTHILKNGNRLSSFYLWYQVDGKLDEAVAEEVRSQLNTEEKKMTGIAPAAMEKASTAASQQKRKLKELGGKPKKPKVDSIKSEPGVSSSESKSEVSV